MVIKTGSPEAIREKIQSHKEEIKRLQLVLRLAELQAKQERREHLREGANGC